MKITMKDKLLEQILGELKEVKTDIERFENK